MGQKLGFDLDYQKPSIINPVLLKNPFRKQQYNTNLEQPAIIYPRTFCFFWKTKFKNILLYTTINKLNSS